MTLKELQEYKAFMNSPNPGGIYGEAWNRTLASLDLAEAMLMLEEMASTDEWSVTLMTLMKTSPADEVLRHVYAGHIDNLGDPEHPVGTEATFGEAIRAAHAAWKEKA